MESSRGRGLFGRFARDAILSFVSLAATSAVYFVLRIYLARYLPREDDLGLYTLAYTAYQFGVILSAFGIGGALVKYVAECEEGSPRRGQLVTLGIALSFVIGCAMCLVLYLASPWIASHFFLEGSQDYADIHSELAWLFRIVALTFPFIAVEKATLGFMNGVRRMTMYTFVNVGQSILTIVLTVILVRMGYGLRGASVAMAAPIAIFGVFSIFAIWRSFGRPVAGTSSPILRQLLRFGLFVVLANGVYMLFSRIDGILIGHYMDPVDVGIYGVAGTLAGMVPMIPNAIQLVTQATIPRYWSRGDIEGLQSLLNRAMKYAAMLVIPISIAGMIVGHDLLSIFFSHREDAAAGTVPLQILLGSFAIGGMVSAIGTSLTSTNWVQLSFLIGLAQMIVNLGLCVVLIPRFGMNGASLATGITHVAGQTFLLLVVQHLLKVRIQWRWFVAYTAVSAAIGAGCLALSEFIDGYFWARCLCALLAAGVLLLVTARFFLSDEDRATIRRFMPVRSKRPQPMA